MIIKCSSHLSAIPGCLTGSTAYKIQDSVQLAAWQCCTPVPLELGRLAYMLPSLSLYVLSVCAKSWLAHPSFIGLTRPHLFFAWSRDPYTLNRRFQGFVQSSTP